MVLTADCGFHDSPHGQKLLIYYGPSVLVNIGLDPKTAEAMALADIRRAARRCPTSARAEEAKARLDLVTRGRPPRARRGVESVRQEALAREAAEAIVRGHDSRCIGERDPHEPWCSCAPEVHPLCDACAELAASIAGALLAFGSDDDYAGGHEFGGVVLRRSKDGRWWGSDERHGVWTGLHCTPHQAVVGLRRARQTQRRLKEARE